MKKLYFSIILIVTLQSFVLAQLDSVYHQGPSQGSQPTGAIQNTTNFANAPEIIPTGEFREIPPIDTRIQAEDSFIDVDASMLPEYIYVEDPNANPNQSVLNGGSVLLDKFQGYTATNAIPPDPSMAVGPNHIIVMVNGFPSSFRIFDKSGNVIQTLNATSFFSPVSPDESGDGQVIYDQFANRWVLSYMQVNNTNQTGANLIAYSDDSDPIGTWYVYRFDTKKHGSVLTNTWGDYPQIGYDEDAIYLTTRVFGFSSGFFGMKLRVIRKSELYNANGGPVTWWDFWDIRRPNANPPAGELLDGIHPTFSYTAGQNGYLFYSHSGNANWYVVYQVLNPSANPPRLRGKQIPSAIYYITPLASQLGGGQGLESGGSVCRTSPIVRDGKMYVAHSTGNTTSPTQGASAKYVVVDLNTPAVIEEAELGALNYFYIYPTLTVDENHNIGMTFTRSATTEYAGAYFSTKSAGDPPGLSPSTPAQVGLGNYQQVSSGRNRWGDYMAIGLDPANNHEMFFHTEYANSGNSWATVVGRIIAAPYSGVKTYVYPDNYDFNDVEIGTTSLSGEIVLANYGDADLVITDIPASFDDFNLVSSITFPLTIASYDSITLEFNYTPTSSGPVNVLYPVTSNDPGLSGINLAGTGYEVTLITEKTFYASSGLQNSGNILTIDPVSGVGSIIGLSLFNEITSLSINPIDGRLYGLIAGSGSADLVKINASAGDAHLLSTISIPLMAGIAFDTTGTLYGITRVGEIYTIDPLTGNTTLVIDAVGSYLGVTFHPQTNELWATSRAIAPPNNDLVFKVNLSTGDTTFVGHTGLGKQTNAIAFDENLNLFGVTGSSAELNNFVGINTSTGAGTIIGSIGYQHILGLAFLDEILTSVEDDNNTKTPSSFTLKQNYPNPFNPSTKIEFSLPVESNVKIIIYNLLGQEVTTLVDGQMQAGNYNVVWNAETQSNSFITSGIYFYKLIATGTNGDEFQEIKKMMLIK